MRTTFEIKGFNELVLEKAIKLGLARSKTDALKLGLIALNEKYNLIENIESELMVKKLKEIEEKMKKKGEKYLTNKEILKKYAYLLD